MRIIEAISKKLSSNYECDYCKKDGDLTNMILSKKGLLHVKCLKQI